MEKHKFEYSEAELAQLSRPGVAAKAVAVMERRMGLPMFAHKRELYKWRIARLKRLEEEVVEEMRQTVEAFDKAHAGSKK